MRTIESPPIEPAPALHPLSPPSGRVPSSKILTAHLEKLAVVYIRQSSPQQVLENRESTARQYAFAEHAVALGWPRDRVLIIDEDLGKSGRTAEGAQRLPAAGHRGDVAPRRVGARIGDEPAGPLIQRLA